VGRGDRALMRAQDPAFEGGGTAVHAGHRDVGVFATRAPVRPNPLGLSVVRLVERCGAELLVEDLDVLDGTPLLDIKPYVEGFAVRLGARGGWTEQVSSETFLHRGERRPDAR